MALRVSRRTLLLLVVALLALFLLTSCLGVDIATKFNSDGSGTMKMKLRISQMLLQMGSGDGEKPVPFTKEDLEASYEGMKGVKLESVDQTETEQDRIITSTVSFKDFSVFESSKDLAGSGATLTKEGNVTVYSVIVGEPPKQQAEPAASSEGQNSVPPPDSQSAGQSDEQPQNQTAETDAAGKSTDEAMQQMIKGLMAGYSLNYSVTAPKPIVSYSVGVVSEDGRTVSYSIKMTDYMELKEPIKFEVKW